MCGITGFVDGAGEEVLARMTAILAHRGPDDSGTFLSRSGPDGCRAGLGSRRLAILDLSPSGHMPMHTADGRYTIVYNGEVYNYPALRRELQQRGYTFKSRSDTEAILQLYALDGPSAVRRLNGMFALAIWDDVERELFLARDHFGIKPLYYTEQRGSLVFASEVKSILEWPGAPRAIDRDALNQYLTFLWVPDPRTMFAGIWKLEAGHYATFRDGRFTVTRYWDPSFPSEGYCFGGSLDTLAAETRERFIDTVRSQMLSDVPLGAFLSAGLDSSSIVAAMAQAHGGPLRTFTITFADKYRVGESTLDDPAVAARTAAAFGAQHQQIVVDPDVVGMLPKLVWHMDEPVGDPAVITAFLVCRDARPHVTVLLSGVGGDELFGGYRKYQAHYLAAKYQRLPKLIRTGLIEPIAAALPSMRGTRFKGTVRLAKKMARSGSLPPIDRFLTDSTYLSTPQKRELQEPAWFTDADPWARHRAHLGHVSDADWLNQMLYLDQKTFMVSLNLTYNDKMSMASSVETRVPFLDWPFAEWVAMNVPPRLKIDGSTKKHVLREAMRPMLPAEVLEQRKAGFGAPADYWLAHDLREMVDDLLGASRVRQRGLFRPAAVRRLIDEHRSGRDDWSLQIWQLLVLELWHQAFIDGGHS